MGLKEQILADMTAAMKAKDSARTSTLRMLKAAMVNRRIEKGGELDNEELTKLLRSQVKQRRDSIEQYRKGARQDLDRRPRIISAPGRLTGRDRAGCRGGVSRNRRHVYEGNGHSNEGRDGSTGQQEP